MKRIVFSINRFVVLLFIIVLSLGIGSSAQPVSAATTKNFKLAPCAMKGSNPKNPTKMETIGFRTVKQNDNTLPAGQTKIIQNGQTGKRLITYTATYKKNVLVGCRHTGTQVAKAPVNGIESVGTYVAPTPVSTPAPTSAASSITTDSSPSNCTNGTYVNSAGDTVCSPETAATAPSGATAKCTDGTYSFSQSRSGTCSHHGGVSSWL